MYKWKCTVVLYMVVDVSWVLFDRILREGDSVAQRSFLSMSVQRREEGLKFASVLLFPLLFYSIFVL